MPACRGVGDRPAAALVRAYGDGDAMLQAAGTPRVTPKMHAAAKAHHTSDAQRRAADGKLRGFRPEVAAALLTPGMAEQVRTAVALLPFCAMSDEACAAQLRSSVARCTPRLDAAYPIPEALAALIREAKSAAAGAASSTQAA